MFWSFTFFKSISWSLPGLSTGGCLLWLDDLAEGRLAEGFPIGYIVFFNLRRYSLPPVLLVGGGLAGALDLLIFNPNLLCLPLSETYIRDCCERLSRCISV